MPIGTVLISGARSGSAEPLEVLLECITMDSTQSLESSSLLDSTSDIGDALEDSSTEASSLPDSKTGAFCETYSDGEIGIPNVTLCREISMCCVFYCQLKTYCGPSSETIQSPE